MDRHLHRTSLLRIILRLLRRGGQTSSIAEDLFNLSGAQGWEGHEQTTDRVDVPGEHGTGTGHMPRR